jgi:hypothetical protein
LGCAGVSYCDVRVWLHLDTGLFSDSTCMSTPFRSMSGSLHSVKSTSLRCQSAACSNRRCRLLPVWSPRAQGVHPDPANEPPTDDQEGLTASGDQASDLDLLVAGAGFEPATSGL